MCLIADPYDMVSGSSYDENRKELVEMYRSLGIEPQLRGNSKKPLNSYYRCILKIRELLSALKKNWRLLIFLLL